MKTEPYLRFGQFTVNARTGELWRDERRIPIHLQAGRLLGLLASRAPELVGYDEIREHLWADRIVEYDQGIHTSVRKIRTALHDTPAAARWIETVPRGGYRMVCKVQRQSGLELGPARKVFRDRLTTAAAVIACVLFQSSVHNHQAGLVTIAGDQAHAFAAQVREAAHQLTPAPPISVTSHTSSRRLIVSAGAGTEMRHFVVDDTSDVNPSRIARWALAAQTRHRVPDERPPPHAREEFFKGKYLLKSGVHARMAAGRLMFQDIVARVPDFAMGFAYLGMAHLLLGDHPAAMEATNKALVLDPQNPLARLTLANIALWIQWDAERSRDLHENILHEYPGWDQARVSYAFLLSTQGKHQHAIAQAEFALELDPVSPTIHGDLGMVYLLARNYGQAAAECQRTLELASEIWVARDCRVSALLALGDTAGAIKEIPALMTAIGVDASTLVAIEQSDAKTALSRYWRWTLEWAGPGRTRWYPYFAANAYVGLGQNDTAIEVLLRAFNNHRAGWEKLSAEHDEMAGTAMLVALGVDPRMDPLRVDQRFARMVRQIAVGNTCCS